MIPGGGVLGFALTALGPMLVRAVRETFARMRAHRHRLARGENLRR